MYVCVCVCMYVYVCMSVYVCVWGLRMRYPSKAAPARFLRGAHGHICHDARGKLTHDPKSMATILLVDAHFLDGLVQGQLKVSKYLERPLSAREAR